ncbi:MAG: hypothetical protein V3T05_08400 [Myxococcota bacterium]
MAGIADVQHRRGVELHRSISVEVCRVQVAGRTVIRRFQFIFKFGDRVRRDGDAADVQALHDAVKQDRAVEIRAADQVVVGRRMLADGCGDHHLAAEVGRHDVQADRRIGVDPCRHVDRRGDDLAPGRARQGAHFGLDERQGPTEKDVVFVDVAHRVLDPPAGAGRRAKDAQLGLAGAEMLAYHALGHQL